jgi:pre-mRNA-splicing factor CWC22
MGRKRGDSSGSSSSSNSSSSSDSEGEGDKRRRGGSRDRDDDRRRDRSRSRSREREREGSRDRDERRSRGKEEDGERARNGGGSAKGGDKKLSLMERTKVLPVGKAGGAYIPPFRLKQMQAEMQEKSSPEYQRMTWEALKKTINGLVNKVTKANISGSAMSTLHVS